jgi:ATP-dependent exoDNAse (exonuclease V) beta subunit
MASYFIKYLEQLNVFDSTKNIYEFGLSRRDSHDSIQPKRLPKIEVVSKKVRLSAIKIAKRESLLWGTFQKEAIDYGNVVHEVMSFVDNKNDVNFAVQISLNKGILKIHESAMVQETINKIVSHPELTEYFNPKNRVYNEQVILSPQSDVVKPDRIVINQNKEYLLLDYKTGKHNNKHIDQIKKYQSVIESMGVKVVKKALVYIGEDLEIIHL